MFQQDYGRYTDEDHDVWATLFREQMAALPGRVVPDYLDAIEALGLDDRRIPEFSALNRRLGELSGWEVQPIDGMISNTDFFGLIRSRRFPSTTWMRSRDELAHSKEPDMFHDVFGHIPLLVDPTYREFVEGLGRIALEGEDPSKRCGRLGRAYKWTIEFGLFRREGRPLVYGAGLISSAKELVYCLGDGPERREFTPREVFRTPHVRASLQPHYFVIDSFEALRDSLASFSRFLDEKATARERT